MQTILKYAVKNANIVLLRNRELKIIMFQSYISHSSKLHSIQNKMSKRER